MRAGIAVDDAEIGRDARRGARMVAGDHDRPAPRPRAPRRSPCAPPARGGSMMPTMPEVHELVLDRLVRAGGRALGQAAGRPPPACAAPGRPARSTSASTSRRRASSSGADLAGDPLVRAPGQQDVGRTLRHDRDPRRPARRRPASVVISLRSEVNGTSPTRSKRCRRARPCNPIFASATRNAASVGSPWTIHSPSSSRSTASLARLPPTEHEADLVEQQRIVERLAVDLQLAVGSVPGAGHRRPRPTA